MFHGQLPFQLQPTYTAILSAINSVHHYSNGRYRRFSCDRFRMYNYGATATINGHLTLAIHSVSLSGEATTMFHDRLQLLLQPLILYRQ